MKPVYATKTLTQADQKAAALSFVWGCTDKIARSLDAVKLCGERGIKDKAHRLDVMRAVDARKGRL